MSESTPPDKDKLVFRSDMKNASQQTTDYFGEQNKKRTEKKRKASKVRKWVLIVGGIVILIIVVIVIFVVVNRQNSGPTITDDEQSDTNSALSGAQGLSEQATDVFDPSYTRTEDGEIVVNGDLEAAEATFAAALANPANKDRIDTIYLSQIIFYSSLSDNQRIVEIAEKVDSNKLNLSEKIKFYNLVYLAYAALGNKDRSDHYYRLMREAADKVTGIGG